MESNRPSAVTIDHILGNSAVGLFQYRMLILCGLAFMTDALEVNLLTFLSTCAGDEWELDNVQRASITSIVFAGILIGSIFWGIFADRFGRKMTFLLVCFIISVGGFASGAAPNYPALLVMRAFVGFGIGGANIPFDLLAEFMPPSHRGRFLIYIEGFWTLGSMFVTGLAWAILSDGNWRMLTYVTAIPVTITSVVSLIYLPESPRWLLMKGRNVEAEKIIRDAALVNGIMLEPFTLIIDEADKESKDADYFELVKSAEQRRITLPLWAVWTLFGFTYYGLILFVSRIYSTDSNDDSTCSFDYAAIFTNSTAELVGVILGATVIDRLGRVRSQSYFYALSAATVFLMGIDMPVNLAIFIGMVGRASIMAASNGTWVTTPELYKTELRTVGHASCAAFSKVGAFLSPFAVISDMSLAGVGILLGICNLLAALSANMLPETSGKQLEPLESPAILGRLLLSPRISRDSSSSSEHSPHSKPLLVSEEARVVTAIETDDFALNPLQLQQQQPLQGLGEGVGIGAMQKRRSHN